MKKILSENDRNRLNGRIKDAEKRTDSQIVLAAIQRCDSYAELPWKAFALGAALAGLLMLIPDFPVYAWSLRFMMFLTAGVIMAGGAFFALLAVICPAFARCFLSVNRAETEVRQYADSMFLSRELFATKHRTGILLLVSLFERLVIVLPDNGLNHRLKAENLQELIAAMTLRLKQKNVSGALEAGLDKLVPLLETGSGSAEGNELSDEIIEEKGV